MSRAVLTLLGVVAFYAGIYVGTAAVVRLWHLPATPFWLPATVAVCIGLLIALTPGRRPAPGGTPGPPMNGWGAFAAAKARQGQPGGPFGAFTVSS